MMPASALYDLCQGALQTVVAGWPISAEPLPGRQFVADSDSVWDCESVAVLVENMFPTQGDPSLQEPHAEPPLLGIRGAVLAVWLLRCVPDLDSSGEQVIFPSVAEMNVSAEQILNDAILVHNLIVTAQQAGNFATCAGMSYENWTPVRSGGIGGGVSRFRVTLLPQDDGT